MFFIGIRERKAVWPYPGSELQKASKGAGVRRRTLTQRQRTSVSSWQPSARRNDNERTAKGGFARRRFQRCHGVRVVSPASAVHLIAALAEAQRFALGSATSSRSNKPTTKAGATHITATAVMASSHHEGIKGRTDL